MSDQISVDDLVKVKVGERTSVSPRNLSSRYGYVTEIKGDVATVKFNDFEADIELRDLERRGP